MERITIAEKFTCGHVGLNSILPTSRSAQPPRNLWSRVRRLVGTNPSAPESIQSDEPCSKCKAEQEQRLKEANELDLQDLSHSANFWKNIHEAHVANGEQRPPFECDACIAQRRAYSILCGSPERSVEWVDQWGLNLTAPSLSSEEEESGNIADHHVHDLVQPHRESLASLTSAEQEEFKEFSGASFTGPDSQEDLATLTENRIIDPNSAEGEFELMTSFYDGRRIIDPDTIEGQTELRQLAATGALPSPIYPKLRVIDAATEEGKAELFKLTSNDSSPSSNNTQAHVIDPDAEEGQLKLQKLASNGIYPSLILQPSIIDPDTSEGEAEIRAYFCIPSTIPFFDIPDYIEKKILSGEFIHSLIDYIPTGQEADDDDELRRFIVPHFFSSFEYRWEIGQEVVDIVQRRQGKKSASYFEKNKPFISLSQSGPDDISPWHKYAHDEYLDAVKYEELSEPAPRSPTRISWGKLPSKSEAYSKPPTLSAAQKLEFSRSSLLAHLRSRGIKTKFEEPTSLGKLKPSTPAIPLISIEEAKPSISAETPISAAQRPRNSIAVELTLDQELAKAGYSDEFPDCIWRLPTEPQAPSASDCTILFDDGEAITPSSSQAEYPRLPDSDDSSLLSEPEESPDSSTSPIEVEYSPLPDSDDGSFNFDHDSDSNYGNDDDNNTHIYGSYEDRSDPLLVVAPPRPSRSEEHDITDYLALLTDEAEKPVEKVVIPDPSLKVLDRSYRVRRPSLLRNVVSVDEESEEVE